MRYEIEILEGLYCLFENSRIIGAYETLAEAKAAKTRAQGRRSK